MAQFDIIEEDILVESAPDEAELNRMAAEDLLNIEEDVKREAEASVKHFDRKGDERGSAEAAETAFDFDEAQRLTADIEAESEEGLDE